MLHTVAQVDGLFHYFLPFYSFISEIFFMFVYCITDALKKIYSSETYKKLEEEESKMWHLGPVALYQDLIEGD